jgi:tol-pal system protein YbgF
MRTTPPSSCLVASRWPAATRLRWAWLALLPLAAFAQAQRAPSLADRVARLEQQAAAGQGSTDLVNQIEQLKTELRDQRGMIEDLQHQLEQLRQAGRTQYLDLDGRLQRLEGTAAPANGGAASPPPTPATPAAAGPSPAGAAPTAPAVVAADAPPTIYGDSGAQARVQDEASAYDAALGKLKAGDYAASARAFQDFLQAFPNGVYAPNALYWLGESYYVTQNYTLALAQFQAVLARYPTSDKAPGALLKVGLSQYGLQQFPAARAAFEQVMQRYPGSDLARTANDRLRAMQLDAVR